MKFYVILFALLCNAFAHRSGRRHGHRRPQSGGDSGEGQDDPSCPRPGPQSGSTDQLTVGQYEALRLDLAEWVQEPAVAPGTGTDIGPRIARVVRLAFHDAVGNPNGCINFEDPGNAGCGTSDWRNVIRDVNDYFDSLDLPISLADFYVLLAEVAIEVAVRNGNEFYRAQAESANPPQPFVEFPMPNFKTTFRFGRQDETNCEQTTDETKFVGLPDGGADTNEVFDFFVNEFDMTNAEIVAIMGCHTLGAAFGGSGYSGFWEGNELGRGLTNSRFFDNRYYKFLTNTMPGEDFAFEQISKDQNDHLDPGCNDPNAEDEEFQWNAFYPNGTVKAFMLNADFALRVQFTGDDGKADCTLDTCPNSRGLPFALEYANNPEAFVRNLETAWEKMTTKGASNLRSPVCVDERRRFCNSREACSGRNAFFCARTCRLC